MILTININLNVCLLKNSFPRFGIEQVCQFFYNDLKKIAKKRNLSFWIFQVSTLIATKKIFDFQFKK